jgi:hypothetical protein
MYDGGREKACTKRDMKMMARSDAEGKMVMI